MLTKYIIIDMYAKAVQGMPAEDAVKWAEGELKKIYALRRARHVAELPIASQCSRSHGRHDCRGASR